MKSWRSCAAVCALVLVCMIGLSACGVPNQKEAAKTEEGVTTNTQAAALEPTQSGTALELERFGECKLYELDELRYFKAEELSSLCKGTLSTETIRNRVRLCLRLLDRDVILMENACTAITADGDEVTIEREVLHTESGWFLPLSTLETLWDRELVADRKEDTIRCLHLTPCEDVLLVNGTRISGCLSCEEELMLPVEQSIELLGGSLNEDTDDYGAARLSVRIQEHDWILTDGAMTAQIDGSPTPLFVPALKRSECWYVSAASAAEMLGGTLITDPSKSRTDLLFAAESAYLWFAGKGMGSCQRIGDTDYTALSALAEQLEAVPEQGENTVTIDAFGHSLTYRGGSVEVLVDGEAEELKTPVIRTEKEWLIPVRQFAKALGIRKLKSEENGLVFSLMRPGETVLWIDGKETPSYRLQDSGPYLELGELAERAEGSLEIAENTAVLSVWGKDIKLTGGSSELGIGDSSMSMSATAVADGAAWYVPANEFMEAAGISVLEDPEIDQIFYTRIVRNDEIEKGYRVPVLMYHAVSDYMWGIPELFISPSTLEEELQALVEGGYTAITFEDLDHIAEIEKPVMLTFDDGYNDNYTELFPLLKKYNVKATVFVIVNDMERVHNLTKEQVREMSDSGLVSFQSHTMSHGYLSGMSAQQLDYEHYQSMLALARITGKQPFVLCYPSGKNTYFSRSYTAKYYQYGLCMSGPCYETGTDPYYICRYYIPRNTALSKFLEYLG